MIQADQPTILPSNVRAIVSSIADGSVKYGVDEPDEVVASNLERLARRLDLGKNQVAGILITYAPDRTYNVIAETNAANIDITDKSTWITCDALVTTQKNVGLLIPIADCNGVVVFDPEHDVLALAHIGWQAAAANLAEELIAYLVKNHGSDPAKLIAYISPSIRKESYYNDSPAQLSNPRWAGYIEKSDKGYHMDVFGFTRDQLISSGLKIDNVEFSDVDVAASDDYYSHFQAKQNDQQAGRYAVLCVMK